MAKPQHSQPESLVQDSAPEQSAPLPEPPAHEQELINQLQRLQAEFENYRKRNANAAADSQLRGQDQILTDLLPILDSIELALKHSAPGQEASAGEQSSQFAELRKGLDLIHAQFLSNLERWQVERIPADGIVDPRLHEVYITETNGEQAGRILETLQPGYTRHGTVLRTAKVKAARNE